ncbi:MAG: DUF4258 domain-containing protein [Sulfurimicrobium sp.]|nr:DUF4258 domain-containing protein [Sulfurimicrobium sp.]
MTTFRLTHHAREEMARRQIPEDVVTKVLQAPEQIIEERGGRKAYQSLVDMEGKTYLVRAIVEEWVEPAAVVTVYRTSNIGKYWRAE